VNEGRNIKVKNYAFGWVSRHSAISDGLTVLLASPFPWSALL